MKFLTPALAGLLVLLVAGLLVAGYIAKNLFAKEEVVQTDPIEVVPMALADLEPGTVITEAHLGNGRIFTSKLERTMARADRVLLGRIVKNRIDAAQPIHTTDLYAPGDRPPVNLEPGMRAVSVNVNGSSQLLGKVIRDGDYVDVHFTPSVTDVRARGGFTMRLFEGVRLIEHSAGRDAASVTLEVSPEQANILILARDRGSLQLAYTQNGPGTGTIAVADADRAYLEEILGLRPMPEPDRFVTEQVNGTSYGTLRFEDDERVGLNNRGNYGYGNGFNGNGGYNGLREPPAANGGGRFGANDADDALRTTSRLQSVQNRRSSNNGGFNNLNGGEIPSQFGNGAAGQPTIPTSL